MPCVDLFGVRFWLLFFVCCGICNMRCTRMLQATNRHFYIWPLLWFMWQKYFRRASCKYSFSFFYATQFCVKSRVVGERQELGSGLLCTIRCERSQIQFQFAPHQKTNKARAKSLWTLGINILNFGRALQVLKSGIVAIGGTACGATASSIVVSCSSSKIIFFSLCLGRPAARPGAPLSNCLTTTLALGLAW